MRKGRPSSLWRREASAIARQGRLMARGRKRRHAPVAGERVGVFVHGFMATGPVFDPMRERVTRETGIPTVDFTYSSFASFTEVTEAFRDFVAAVVPAGALVSLVGHSLGGLVARWYLQEQGGQRYVDRAVLLATPHAGTRSARWPFGSLARAIQPDSPVIRRLDAGRDAARGIPHVLVVAGADRMVTPPSSAAALDGAQQVVWLDEVGHNEMLYDERVYDTVTHALR